MMGKVVADNAFYYIGVKKAVAYEENLG